MSRYFPSRLIAPAPEATSVFPFMVVNWFEPRRQPGRELYALVKMPGATKSVKKELHTKGSPMQHNGGRQRFGSGPPSSSGSFGGHKSFRGKGGPRSRQASKVH
jgi:hypothetical protein